MTKRQLIISLTPGLVYHTKLAQDKANRDKRAYGVWEHVGLYGRPEGDIPARHHFIVRDLNGPDPADVYALVACCDPEGV